LKQRENAPVIDPLSHTADPETVTTTVAVPVVDPVMYMQRSSAGNVYVSVDVLLPVPDFVFGVPQSQYALNLYVASVPQYLVPQM
jgi:hypothetical protein